MSESRALRALEKENDKLQELIKELERRIKVIKKNRNDLFDETVQQAERIKELEAALSHIAEDGCPKCGNVAEQALKG